MNLFVMLLFFQAAVDLPRTPRMDNIPEGRPLFALASVTADSRLPQDGFVSPQDLLRLEQDDRWARTMLSRQSWEALWGDLDGDGAADAPAGLDALDLVAPPPGASTTVFELQFSMDRDAFGFRDGDVLGIGPDTRPFLVLSEDALVQALDLADGGLDLDAMCWQEDGELWFSLRDDEDSLSLGVLEDGAILAYDPRDGSGRVIATEGEVQGWVDHARGGTAAIGDLKALARHPVLGYLLFTIQSPSADDAAVFTDEDGGRRAEGWGEPSWDFQVATELDALCFPRHWWGQAPVLATDLTRLPQDATFHIRIRHATPWAFLRGRATSHASPRRSSRGGLGLSLPVLGGLAHRWPAAHELPLTTDGSGSATQELRTPVLPAGVGSMWMYYQALDTAYGGLSTPLLLFIEP
jgi:hypothetical protein